MTQTAEQRLDAALERLRVMRKLCEFRGWLGADPEAVEEELRGENRLDRAVAYVASGEYLAAAGDDAGVGGDSRFAELLEAAAPAVERAAEIAASEYAALLTREGGE